MSRTWLSDCTSRSTSREAGDRGEEGEDAQGAQVHVVRRALRELMRWRVDRTHGDILVEEEERGEKMAGGSASKR